jgi:hypothetical protein
LVTRELRHRRRRHQRRERRERCCTWDRCYDFKNIFAEKIAKKISVFDQKQS